MKRSVDVGVGAAAVAVALAVALACGPTGRRAPPVEQLLDGMSGPDPATEAGCQLTARRCTACHDIDRVLAVQPADPFQWQQTIGKMRRMRGSGISDRDGHEILRCLVFRSFGAAGLRDIDAASAPGRDVVDEPPR